MVLFFQRMKLKSFLERITKLFDSKIVHIPGSAQNSNTRLDIFIVGVGLSNPMSMPYTRSVGKSSTMLIGTGPVPGTSTCQYKISHVRKVL